MGFSRAWLNFKRMEDISAIAAVLVYGAGVSQAFRLLPGGAEMVVRWTLVWPIGFLLLTAVLPLAVPVLRRGLSRYVWMSFRAGFGQSAGSVLLGVGLLLGAALLIQHQLSATAATGRYGANIFSAFAAGIGILIAQAVLVRGLERDPRVRALILEP